MDSTNLKAGFPGSSVVAAALTAAIEQGRRDSQWLDESAIPEGDGGWPSSRSATSWSSWQHGCADELDPGSRDPPGPIGTPFGDRNQR
jgi:hypothetical protein